MIRNIAAGKMLVGFAFCLFFMCLQPQVWAAKSSLPFDDISRSYAKDAIIRLYKLDLIEGTGNRRFEPAKPITRAEFITMIDRLFGVEPVVSAIPAFSDVAPEDWFYRWVQPSVQLGIAKGTSSSRFEPNRVVSRQDAAVMLAAALKQPVSGVAPTGKPVYKDQKQIAASALPSVLQLRKLTVMQGDGVNFRPASPVTRQEAAIFMDRVLQHQDWADQIRAKPAAKIQLGWQYGSTTQQYEGQIAQSNVNTLSPRWFYLDKYGTVKSSVDPAVVAWAHARGKKVWAMVGNRSNDTLTHDILSDPALRKSTILSLTSALRNDGIDGLNIDFENVSPQDRGAMTDFIAELGEVMHEAGSVLSVNVSPDYGTDWTQAFDYTALGKSADYLVMMGYDEHWGGSSTAGSVSSLPWLRRGLNELLTHIPSRKLILALPLYTRDWIINASGVKSDDWSLVKQNDTVSDLRLKPTWNADLGQYVTVYRQQNVTHQLWLEDARSLTAKTRLGEQLDLAGYAYWYMGGESSDVWASLRNLMKYTSFRF